MAVKLVMNWDIKEGRDQEYFEFVVREWMPALSKLGLQATDKWLTQYSHSGDTSQIMHAVLTENLASMQAVLKSEDWKQLTVRLLEFVENYSHKVVRVNGGFPL